MFKSSPYIILLLPFISHLSHSDNISEQCHSVVTGNTPQHWHVSFTSNLAETIPYFTNGKNNCYIGHDVPLSHLNNYRFHAFMENRTTGKPVGNIYDVKVNHRTTIESLKFDSTYGYHFPSLRVYDPNGTLVGGAGTQSLHWWGHRYNADTIKPGDYPYPQIAWDFPSGNAGQAELQKTDVQSAAISLKNDGKEVWMDDIPKWRNWWYVELSGIFTDTPFTLEIHDRYSIDKRGWEYDYTPVYSYDRKTWHRFDLNDLQETTSEENGKVIRTIQINKQFENNRVWVSRFYPYSMDDFERFYITLEDSLPKGFIRRETLGKSPVLKKSIDMITISNPYISDSQKSRIWVHARTHAAEVGGSFLIEGLMNFLTESTSESQIARDNLIFHIVPIHNPDGVELGNYRLNGRSENLESLWIRDEKDPMYLKPEAPIENRLLNAAIRSLVKKPGAFTLALNFHSSQSERSTRPFFFPHFGPETLGYSQEEAMLWSDSIRFINLVQSSYGPALIEPSPGEGGSFFSSKNYPESWWWANYGNRVMAITLETTYDQSGFAPSYVTQSTLRKLGRSIGTATLAYHDLISPPAALYLTPIAHGRLNLGTRSEVRSKE